MMLMEIPRGEMIEPFEWMREEFGRMLSQFAWPWRAEEFLWPYGVDVREDAEHIYIEADLPGFTKEEVDVRIENQVLTISAEHKREKKEKKIDYLLHERGEQAYTRSFNLPIAVDDKAVDAKLINGVLSLTLNKKEEAKPHKVLVH